MKCELCLFQEKPDNLHKLTVHLETCSHEQRLKASAVWRNGEVTATLNPLEEEMKFPMEIRDLPDPEVPSVVVPKVYTPDVVQMSLEPTKRGTGRRSSDY